MAYPPGFRFNPFDYELIGLYLKPKIAGNLPPSCFIKDKQVYGELSNPWLVFDSAHWFQSPDLKKTEKCVYVFARLSKLSKSETSDWKNTSKWAGCGTWANKGKTDRILDCGGNLIGEKRYLVFEINDLGCVEAGVDLSTIGQYKMHQYSVNGAASTTTVLCKITHYSSQQCKINIKPGNKAAALGKVSKEEEVVEESKKGISCVKENLSSDVGDLGGSGSELCLDDLDGLEICLDDLDIPDFCLDGLGGVDFCSGGDHDLDLIGALLDSDQLEEHTTSSKLGKRKYESDDNLYRAKKMCSSHN